MRLVVAHELGHVHYDDVPRGLLYLAIVAPFGMFAVARLSERLAPAGGPAAIPAVALSLALLVPALTMISNQLSRQVEARADRFSLELTDAPDALIGFQQRIVVQNVVGPRPARLGVLPARHAPDRDGADRPGARRQGSGGGSNSGRFLISPLVCHLDQLSSIASISSRMKRGETLMRETTTPGTSSLSTSWSTRANVIVNS